MSQPDDVRVFEADGMGVKLPHGGAVEVAIIEERDLVSIRIIEADDKATHMVISRTAMDAIGELYVELADKIDARVEAAALAKAAAP